MFYSQIYPSPIGNLEIITDEQNLVAIWIIGQKHYRSGFKGTIITTTASPTIMQRTIAWLDAYFAGQRVELNDLAVHDTLPLAPQGSEFRQSVWQILRTIRYGKTITYGEIAAHIAAKRGIAKMSAQAVGGAVGHNPIAIIVPCHRVLGQDSTLTGYAGGLNVKRQLLRLENISYRD